MLNLDKIFNVDCESISVICIYQLAVLQSGKPGGAVLIQSTCTHRMRKVMHHTCNLLCVIFGLLNIAGCTSTITPYPADWSKSISNPVMECPDLTGSYENSGVMHRASIGRVQCTLAWFFFPECREGGPDYGPPACNQCTEVTHVTVDNSDGDMLVVKAWIGDDIFKERLFNSSQLSCDKGRRIIHDSTWFGGVLPVWYPPLAILGHDSTDNLITLASDGSLVVESKELRVGTLFLMPLDITSAQSWLKFQRTTPKRTD